MHQIESHPPMQMNQQVTIKVFGDPREHHGIVINPKKMWVEIADFYGHPFIADENNILEWKPFERPFDAPV